jgi:thiol-disulfide isomerase/thioredoxin
MDPGPAEPDQLRLPSSRRRYAVVALVLAGLAVVAVLVASGTNPTRVAGHVDVDNLPVGPKAPTLEAEGWLNSPPLGPADLTGKVVVYDFWTYSCVNCVRTLPYLRSWYQRYAGDGLVIVGVHSPEFEFEKSHTNVTNAVRRLDVTWPVAFDDDMKIWNAFGNRYWPAKYVTDRTGRLRYLHFGEGAYDEVENVLRKLLGVKPGAPRAAPHPERGTAHVATNITPETYLGTERGPGDARVVGAWTSDREKVLADASGASIELSYRAREVNLVMSPAPAGPVDMLVELDGKPLPPPYRTSQTRVDDAGRTLVRVDAPDLFRLVLGPAVESHTLRLTAQGPGLQAFAFTFGA